ncbi:LTA synthase family protein [Dokdonella sp.]|uniref:LTA synthase family protein n=1 Tax=Dokdonella sp. TaxID=2291710 RepID=UPI003C33598A
MAGFLGLSLAAATWLVMCCDPAFQTDPAGAAGATPPITPWLTILLNALPAVALAFLLLAISRRGMFSLLCSIAALYLLYFANEIKLDLLDTPLLPGDFQLLAHLGDSGELLSHYVTTKQLVWVIGGFAFLVLLGVIERQWSWLRGRSRIAVLALSCALAGSLIFNLPPWKSLYAPDDAEFMSWSPGSSALEKGLAANLLNYIWRFSYSLPSINHKAAEQLLSRHPLPAAAPDAADLPDIIVVQSESFFDPARLNRMDSSEMLPRFRELAARHRHGDLWVPAYGGGTIRTEFEVLTGLAVREFPNVEYPYFSLTRPGMPSLAQVLGSKGYSTVAVHPNSRDFWNRASAFRHMGFSEFDDVTRFPDDQRLGYYISDQALTDHILKRLDRATAPMFIFAISIQNHGPYDHYPNVDPELVAAQPVPSGINSVAAARLRGYFHHLEDADHALGELVDALSKRRRRSVLLFYGDHLPALPRIYAELAFDDGAPGPSQPTPWLLIDSGRPPGPAAPAEATSSFYLPALLLDAAGIDDRGYFRLLDRLRLADAPARDWTPPYEEGLRAIMRLQERGELKVH